MSAPVYVDASALVKAALPEHESEALRAALLAAERVVASEVVHVEAMRAAARHDHVAVVRMREALERVELVKLSDDIRELAATVPPPRLRTLDAIHLATALRFRERLDAFVVYDERLAEAAADRGLRVLSPGR